MLDGVAECRAVVLRSHRLHRHHLVRLVEVLVLHAHLALQRRVVQVPDHVRQRALLGDGEAIRGNRQLQEALVQTVSVLALHYASRTQKEAT